MPHLKLPDCELYYEVDDFIDPWTQPQTVLMLHGNMESSRAWYAWVPVLARHFHLVRPDMRGYGRSTPMPRDYQWTLDQLIDDYVRPMDSLGIGRFHLVAAKIGGTIARAFAGRLISCRCKRRRGVRQGHPRVHAGIRPGRLTGQSGNTPAGRSRGCACRRPDAEAVLPA